MAGILDWLFPPDASEIRRRRGRIPGQFRRPPMWMKRSLDPFQPDMGDNNVVHTASTGVNGKEFLYPTLRQNPDLALRPSGLLEAIENKDYLEFDSPEEATAYSKAFSSLLNPARKNYPGLSSKATEFVREYRKRMYQDGEEKTRKWFPKAFDNLTPEDRINVNKYYVRIYQ